VIDAVLEQETRILTDKYMKKKKMDKDKLDAEPAAEVKPSGAPIARKTSRVPMPKIKIEHPSTEETTNKVKDEANEDEVKDSLD
jgi:hypothetical protein